MRLALQPRTFAQGRDYCVTFSELRNREYEGLDVSAVVDFSKGPDAPTSSASSDRFLAMGLAALMEAQRHLVDVVHTLRQVVCVKG
jgi:hypothetical protein